MKTILIFALFLLALSLFTSLPHAAAVDTSEWELPQGAKARLGKGGINDITCTPDGTLLAVASKIGIWIYDVQTSDELALLTGHTGSVDRIAFSPDGRTLASGGQDNTVRLWDVDTQTEIGTLEGHTGGQNSIFFSPDGRTLASRDDDNTVRLWDVDTQTQIRTLEGYTGSLESVSFSPDGRILASGGQDEIVRLWDVDTRTEIGILEGHTGYVSSVSFSPGGKTIVSGNYDRTVRLWDVDTQTEIGILEGHIWPVSSVVFSPDGKTIASGSNNNINNTERHYYDFTLRYDSTVRLWDVDTKTEIGVLEGTSNSLSRVSFSPDGQTIARMYLWGNYHVDFWDVDTLTRMFFKYNFFEHKVFEHIMWEVLWVVAVPNDDERVKNIHTILWEHTGAVESISFSPDGKIIAASVNHYYTGIYPGPYYTRMWDVATLMETNTFDRWGDKILGNKSISFSPNGNTILSRCGQYVICLRDSATYTEIDMLEIWDTDISSLVFSPDGHTLASAGSYWDTREFVRLWDMDTDTEIGILLGHIGVVKSLSFSPDGRTLATAGSIDATVRLWDVDTLTEVVILQGHTGWVNSVSFSPDGKQIVSGSNDRTVRLWDVDTRTEIGILEGHIAAVNSVAFSPDGKTIASGSNDGTVRLWDVATQTGMGILKGHTDAVNSVAFSPDGKTIASGSNDGTVLLWNITSVDHGNTLVEATVLLAGGSLTAKIDPGNDVDYFSIPIEVHGQLTLWTTTTGTLDTIGTLQNSEGTTLATNADENGDEALTFRIEHVVEPGTYYINVQSGGQQTGEYTLYAAFVPATDVNSDGVVNIQDLVLVSANFGKKGQQGADVNRDGVVNITDLVLVAGAFGDAAAAPSAFLATATVLPSQATVKQWLADAYRLSRLDARLERGIAWLERLLAALVPEETALLANYPNPFNPETWIPYELADPADVTLRIYATDGKLVRKLDLGQQPAGTYQAKRRAAYWDGRNVVGESVASGLYFYTLTAGDFTATRRMLILK